MQEEKIEEVKIKSVEEELGFKVMDEELELALNRILKDLGL